jgi:hypothetical protein
MVTISGRSVVNISANATCVFGNNATSPVRMGNGVLMCAVPPGFEGNTTVHVVGDDGPEVFFPFTYYGARSALHFQLFFSSVLID